ncbi:hypothetical protein GGS24DRAFT_499697 [Hypoxylon argillaceum]|nr:hypothetical protein GGS24DRAFT_499697 [Hypoxylon argillaceum]
MAIEDADIRDKEVWASVSRHWFLQASIQGSTTGRLGHHLAILARPNDLQELHYYARSLCMPLVCSMESITALFEPIIRRSGYQHIYITAVDAAFVKAHSILYSQPSLDDCRYVASEFLGLLDENPKSWEAAGYYITLSTYCDLLSQKGIQNDKVDNGDHSLDRLWYGHLTTPNRTPAYHSDNGGLPTSHGKIPNSAFHNNWPFYFGFYEGVSKFIMRVYRHSRLSLKHAAFYSIVLLRGVAGAAITTNSAGDALEASILPAPIQQHDNGNWTLLLYTNLVLATLFSVLLAIRTLGQPLLFHGVSMGIFGIGYLLMVFNSHMSFDIQFTTWLGCATFTFEWIRWDIRDMSAESKKITTLALVVISLFLDLGIVSTFEPRDNQAMDGSQSKPFLFVAFLLPLQRNGRDLQQHEFV